MNRGVLQSQSRQSAGGLAHSKTQSSIGFSPSRRLYEAGGQPMITGNIDKMSKPLNGSARRCSLWSAAALCRFFIRKNTEEPVLTFDHFFLSRSETWDELLVERCAAYFLDSALCQK
jgi:hypothetical protein